MKGEWRAGLVSILLMLASPLGAEAVLVSPVPRANPMLRDEARVASAEAAAASTTLRVAPAASETRQASAAATYGIRPRPRPAPLAVAAAPASAPVSTPGAAPAQGVTPEAGTAPVGIARSLRPKKRPDRVVQRASAPASVTRQTSAQPRVAAAPPVASGGKGSVCGVAAIRGEPIAPIRGKVAGCGLADGVRVTSVSGVRLSTPITVDCATARALNTWVANAVQPAYGGTVVELKIAGHYVCRPRNNKRGAKISEHGRGKAVDIAGFAFSNGKVVNVKRNYDKTMRKVHRQACGIFGTTLGPGSDGYHEDHLHFDTASYRNGAYCR